VVYMLIAFGFLELDILGVSRCWVLFHGVLVESIKPNEVMSNRRVRLHLSAQALL
jgi:hypothetical protein